MLDHHIQRAIVKQLTAADGLRFSELQPEHIENKLFSYHLKKVIQAGLVVKVDDGKYALSELGLRLGKRLLDKTAALSNHAYSVLFLIVRYPNQGPYLLYRRKTQPLRSKIGFMHTTPQADRPIAITAQEKLSEYTGLNGSFDRIGGGLFKIYDTQHNLQSFTHFEVMLCTDVSGKLTQKDTNAEYFLTDSIPSDDPNMLPNMNSLVKAYRTGTEFFLEETLVSSQS